MLAGAPPPPGVDESLGTAVAAACSALGARVWDCRLLGEESRCLEESAIDDLVDRALGELGGIDLLVVDAAALFSSSEWRAPESRAPARDSLAVCLEASWNVTRAAVNRAFLAHDTPGRVVYLTPAPDAGAYAEAVRAGLENLARTLSIEWARFGITTVAITPGADTSAGDVAALTAYLASPAGVYFSGCLLDLRGPAGTPGAI